MIFNKTQHTVISQKELSCDHFLSKSIGLMFHPRKNMVMVFPEERRISIHTFFVFYPIEIIVVDKNKIVIEIRKNLKPFTVWNSSQKGKYLLELAFPSNDYNLGDMLEMNY